jgi:hypothetical protein
MKIVHDFCDMDGSFSDSRSKTSSGTDSSAGTLRYRLGHGVEQSTVKDGTTSTPSSSHKNPREWGDVCAMKDKVSKSMRELVPKLKSPSNMRQLLRKTEAGKKFLPSSNALSQSTHTHTHTRDTKTSKRECLSAQSLHRPLTPKPSAKESLGQSLHRLSMARSASLAGSPKAQSMKVSSKQRTSRTSRDDSSHASFDPSFQTLTRGGPVPYFEKLCWVCEQIQYPFEYADIVGSQFLGLDGANPVTHVDGHIPTMDELSEFLALVIICIANYADLAVVVLDDFQWVDTFSWKVFQILSKKWDKLLLLCAARSHDKQAIRRLSAAASGQIYSQQNMIEITLAPLDFPEIRQLISKVLKHNESAITDSFCSDIFQRTGGLPVYVVQALENIRRKKTVELDKNGILQWTAEGLKDKVRSVRVVVLWCC